MPHRGGGEPVVWGLESETIRNLTQGIEKEMVPLGDVAAIIQAGNVFEYAKQMGMVSAA